jgi:ATP-dependent helicase/nuclease subunit B
MAAMNPTVHAALGEGALVVTPNRRLARFLQREFDQAQRAVGREAWNTPRIVPYPVWLESLWQEAVAADDRAAPELLLTAAQVAQLWREVVVSEGMPLLDPHGAAALAAEAWTLAHEWGAGGESWRAWRRAEESDDAALFGRWAEVYRTQLQRAGALDLAQVPARLIALGARMGTRCATTILAGFTELSPQQERLCAALTAAGARLRLLDTLPSAAGVVARTLAASPRAELVAALDRARLHAQRAAGAQIGIVVADLAARRDEVVALAVELLCPAVLLPGSVTASTPFEVSLGIPLATVPLVVAALDLITLSASRLALGAAATLLRSPYLPEAAQRWAARAGSERVWLEEGRREVTLNDAIAALEIGSPELCAAWREGRDALRRTTAASPREWVDAWRSWLAAAGWPGSRPLDSGEYQARDAWERMLGQLASLGAVSRRLAPAAALDALQALARETIFQPEGSAAPIQIMGVLEATGLTFDALWVAGLSADRWPPPPAPNPLLPIVWQRERNVPRGSAARELTYAQTLTARFARAAAEVTLSSAASADDHALSPSALILAYPQRSLAAPASTWVDAIAHSATLEAVADEHAPSLAEGMIAPGGSRIVAAQSDCPFQAVARHRLGAQPWPALDVGLSAPERGLLLHSALAHFWHAVADHAALCALSAAALATAIAAAVEAALEALPASRWRNVPPVVRSSETRRLAALLESWLGLERGRAPFTVRQVEAEKTLGLGGLTFRLRLDRVDDLAAGGLAIVDYKSGRVERPGQWFDPRPRASQLGLYTLAQRALEPSLPVRVIAYGQLQAGAIGAFGLAADGADWPGLAAVADVAPGGDWPALEAWWQRRLGLLATEIAHGHAAVSPRESPLPCGRCGLQAVCRIQSARELFDSEAEDE